MFEFLDGEQRWLAPVLQHRAGTVLQISTADRRLRHLPWELLATGGAFLAVAGTAPVLPVRTVGARAALPADVAAGNRPLRVLFMATSPEAVEPVLNYEAEEATILAAASSTSGIELVVEESGTLDGLRAVIHDYGDGYFDVLHLSGHAAITDGVPVFVMENELGQRADASAEQIAQALDGVWPRLVFVSGCWTAGSPDAGAFPSMSESLVQAGAVTVLGWALPVGDGYATDCAATLYQGLANGDRIDRSVLDARRTLYRHKSPHWHLLRVYTDRSPLAAIVTPRHTRGRQPLRVRPADQQFLDPQTGTSRVASRAAFVGRRRVIQRCLRTLNQPTTSGGAEALVLHGMGGLGKSSLASRLLERMPTHQRAVWIGRIDMIKFRELTTKIRFPRMDLQTDADRILDNPDLPLASRLQYLLDPDGPLGQTPCLFVFDDFEDGNLHTRDSSDGDSHVLSPDMADILPALLTAIAQTGSRSRVIITSRYRFPTPTGTHITIESLETLTAVEQDKKLAGLANLRPGSLLDLDPDPHKRGTRQRAITAAAGNPRLLDWLDLIVADHTLDVDALLTAIESETVRFREHILAERLLNSQDPELRRMLAAVSVVELPVPATTVHHIHHALTPTNPDTGRHLTRAVQLGLLEEGTDPTTSTHRYYVSNLLRPLLPLTSDEHTHACAAAAQSLYPLWVTATDPQPATDPEPGA